MMVAQTSRRKRKTTSTTSRTLMMSEISTSCTLARMVVVRSTATSILMVGGMAACRRGSSRQHAVHGVDDVGAGNLEDEDAGWRLLSWPLWPVVGLMPATPAVWMSETPSYTVPRSATRTGAPVCWL